MLIPKHVLCSHVQNHQGSDVLGVQKQSYPWGISGKQSLFCELGVGLWSALLLKGRFFLLDGFTSVPQNSLPSNSQHEREASVICLGLGEEKDLWSVMILLFHHKGTDALNIASIWFMFPLSQSCSSGPAGLCCQSFCTGGKIKSQISLLSQF